MEKKRGGGGGGTPTPYKTILRALLIYIRVKRFKTFQNILARDMLSAATRRWGPLFSSN
jgi:hypothetical protein